MIFTELRFLLFLAVVFVVAWSLAAPVARKAWLLAVSFAFYAAWDWRFLSLIVISILVDYGVGLGLERTSAPHHRRLLLLASLTANLGMLGFFKYCDFFIDSSQRLLRLLGFEPSLPSLQIVLPVGISFFTFQTLSYSIDVYRRRLPATRNLLDLALFVAFFPQLVAGPIVRASSFLPQLRRLPSLEKVRFAPLLTLFLFGFVKKACVADNIALVVDPYFAEPQLYDATSAWIAVLLYAIQIYCDFSGYSDMAIASAGLLGFDLGPNFRHPYLAVGLREFWQRWHISLSTWLRDYLYVPLGGNRNGALLIYRNLLITMLLGGLWHGAAWNFVLWGGLHGLGLVIVRFCQRSGFGVRSAGARLLSWGLTLYWVCFAWIFFRAPDLEAALDIAESFVLLRGHGVQQIHPAWIALFLAFAGVHAATARRLRPEAFEALPRWAFAFGYGAACALALLFVQIDVQPFIYFQF